MCVHAHVSAQLLNMIIVSMLKLTFTQLSGVFWRTNANAIIRVMCSTVHTVRFHTFYVMV